MKKLLLSLFSLAFIQPLFADTITGGSVGLLQPSTNTVDASRSYGAKLNENFKIIAASMTGIISKQGSALTIYDEGSPQGNINTLNVTGSGVAITVAGATGTLNVSASGGGGGSGGGFTFNGSQHVAFSTIAMPGVTIITGTDNVSTFSVTTSSLTWTAAPTFKSSATFLVPISSLGIQGNLVIVGSGTSRDVFTSTTGFIAPSSTFAFLSVSTMIAVSSGTFNTLTVSSFSVVGGTVILNGVATVWSPVPPTVNQIPKLNANGHITWSADATGAGGTGENWGNISTRNVDMNDFGIANSTGLELGNFLQLTTYLSTNTIELNALRSSITVIRESTATFNTRFNTFSSTVQAEAGIFKGWFSTFTVQIDSISATIGGIAPSTRTLASNFSLWLSTTQGIIKSTAANLADNTGTINAVGNPIHWQKLYDVPAGFADGTDDGSGGGVPSLQNPTTGIHNLQSDAGTRYGIANSTGIEVGQNLQLTAWMSTMSAAVGTTGKASLVWDFDAVSLHALTTDYAVADSTSSKLNFYLGRLFPKDTTSYMHGKRVLPTNLDISSTIYFQAIIRSTNPAAGTNVQILFTSTATSVTGPSFLDYSQSTGADAVALTNNQGQLDVANWSQSVSALGWKPDQMLFFKFGRGHDTSKLTTTDYPGGLYILSVRMIIPVIASGLGNADNMGNATATKDIDMTGFGIDKSTFIGVGTTNAPIFRSTWSATAMNGFTLTYTTGSIAANTSITITATNLGGSSLWGPLCSEVEDVNTATLTVRLKDLTGIPSNFVVFNADLTQAKRFACWVGVRP